MKYEIFIFQWSCFFFWLEMLFGAWTSQGSSCFRLLWFQQIHCAFVLVRPWVVVNVAAVNRVSTHNPLVTQVSPGWDSLEFGAHTTLKLHHHAVTCTCLKLHVTFEPRPFLILTVHIRLLLPKCSVWDFPSLHLWGWSFFQCRSTILPDNRSYIAKLTSETQLLIEQFVLEHFCNVHFSHHTYSISAHVPHLHVQLYYWGMR